MIGIPVVEKCLGAIEGAQQFLFGERAGFCLNPQILKWLEHPEPDRQSR
jgi:hypothetical protein